MLNVLTLARYTAALAVIIFLSAGVALAQVAYYPATTQDYPISSPQGVSGVLNTGCEVAYYGTGGALLKAIVWDSSNGSYLGWDLDGTTGSLPLLATGAQDPDVVVDPGPSTTGVGTGKMLVTYTVNGNIFYEVRQLNATGTSLTTIKGSTQVNTTGLGQCANPNVDVNNNGEAVIVWEQNGLIYARTFALTASTSTTNLGGVYQVVGNQPGFVFSQPDVAFNRNTNNESNDLDVASFVFVATNTATAAQTIRMVQPPVADLRSGATLLTRDIDIYTGFGRLNTPRISATHNYGGFGSYGYEVVLTDSNSSDSKVIGLNNSRSSLPVHDTFADMPRVTVLNETGDGITPLYALAAAVSPVVTYAGDAILVAWTNGGPAPATRYGDKDVLQLRLDYNTGAVQNYNQFNGDGYAIVNQNEIGSQYLPAIAGRLTATTPGGLFGTNDALYAFLDEAQSLIAYKSSPYNNVSLRPGAGGAPAKPGAGQVATRFAAYPNPFNGTATLDLALGANEQVRSLRVYNTTGQLVSTLTPASAGSIVFDGAAAGLKPGLYVLQLTTTHGSRSLRLHYR
ncbi:T9SS type A sorting domain-containing protein [Hymenobacter edaphi]|uniref:Secretion system C-terminal sorting domain-containing protein n=1 Tax=Hymenobacter edaphi TaxID=2211146 RepID=A0A328BEP8_9BACT|nr:T9SS type A sorting domain-containing protein [Hymenobacter edaphi]RAK65900.1 hypothetical protein DLM85_14415 [Hymenobacter edaphi]